MNKQSLLKVFKPPNKKDPAALFLFNTYRRWGAMQLCKFIDAHPEISTLEAVDLFISDMNKFACLARSEKRSYMFSVMGDVAEYAKDILIAEEFTLERRVNSVFKRSL